MMKLIERLRRITIGRIEAFLDSVEKPEHVLPQLIREMNAQVNAAANAEAKALAAVKGAQRRFDEASGRLERLTRGATLAAKANELDLAKKAIAAQIQSEKKLDKCSAELQNAELAYTNASDARKRLTETLNELKKRKDELITKAKKVNTQIRTDTATEDILETVARMEEKLDTAQAEIEIRNEISKTLGLSFDQEKFNKLPHDDEVQRRLDQIMKK